MAITRRMYRATPFIVATIAMLVIMLCLGLVLMDAVAVVASPVSVWSFVQIPGHPSGAYLGQIWTGEPGEVFIWTSYMVSSLTVTELYHLHEGSWSVDLYLPGHYDGQVFGTNPTDVFATAYDFTAKKARMFHYDGTTWSEQALPAQIGTGNITSITGETGNVYSYASCSGGDLVLRYDGSVWSMVWSNAIGHRLAYIAADEIYGVT